MDGSGFALTAGSALYLNNIDSSQKASSLNELFGSDGVRMSYLRVSVGTSGLDIRPFSYNDLPSGKNEDLNLDHFSIAKDQINLIPVLNSTIGGSLKSEYYSVYANYLVKYIKAYRAEGITIDVLSVQNEPQHEDNNPTMRMEAK